MSLSMLQLQQDPSQSAQLLAAILDHTHMMAVYLDARFNFIWVNPAYAATCGYDPSFFSGKNHFDLYPHAENQAIFQKVVDTGEPFFAAAKPFTYPDQPERGVTYWDWSLIPVTDPQGRVNGLVFTLAEVTDRVRTEASLRESEAKYRFFVETAQEGIWAMDEGHRTTFVNRRMAEMLGYEPAEMIGRSVESFMFDEDLFDHARKMAQRRKGLDSFYERRFRREDGSQIWCQVSATAIIDPQGRFAGSHALFTDITQRRKAEADLRESEEKYRKTFESITDSITITRMQDGRYLYVNDGFCHQTGYAREEVMGKTPADIDLYADPTQRERFIGILRAQGQARDVLVRFRRKNGEIYYSEFSAKPLNYKGEDCLVAQSREVTEKVKTEQALRQSEANLKSLFNAISESVCLFDRDGKMLAVNDTFARRVGRTAADCIGRSVYSLIPDDVAAKRRAVAEQVFRSGQPAHFEDQRYGRWLDHNLFPVLDQDGAVDRLAVYARDVTDLKRSFDEQRKLQEQLANALEMAKLGHWEYDVVNDRFTFNDQFYKLFRTTAAEQGGYTMASATYAARFVHPEDMGMVAEEVRLAIAATDPGFARYIEHRVRYADGTFGHIAVRYNIVKDDRGQTVRTYGVNQDITERKLIETSLWESKQRFEKVFNSQLDAIFVLDAQLPARIVECNKAATTIFGYRTEEMVANPVAILHGDETHLKAFQNMLYPAIRKEGFLHQVRFTMKRKDGTVFPSEHTVLELKNDRGERIGWVSVVRDLTEREQLEARVQQAQKMEAIGALAGGIAHDFNNILFPIIGLSEMLLDDLPAGSPERENVAQIFQAAARARDLVKQILAFSRQGEHKKTPVRIQSILKEAVKLARATIPSNIPITEDIRSDCGLVLADSTQLHQIAMNLITNAFHAVEQTGGEISIGLEQALLTRADLAGTTLEPGAYALIRVSDTGHGIDPALMDKIFDPYFTTKAQGKGTGLGLAVVYGIVKAHGGDIHVASPAGRGATFTVYLPVLQSTAPADTTIKKTDRAAGGTEHILLVDDEAAIARMQQVALQRLGYTVTVRTSSVDALATFNADPTGFDLVITDMAMPNLTGDQLARNMIEIRPAVRIIICTGFSERMDEARAKALGIKGFVMKPVLIGELASQVRRVLDS